MAISVTIPDLGFYADQTGRAPDVRVQPRKADGTTTGAALSATITEVGGGYYAASLSVPDDTVFLDPYLLAAGGESGPTYDRRRRVADLQASAILAELDGMTDEGVFTEASLVNSPANRPVRLVFGPLSLFLEGEDPDGVAKIRRGDKVTLRGKLRDYTGAGVPITGAQITASVLALDDTELIASGDITITPLLEDEGIIDIKLDASVEALSGVRRARLVVVRTGDSDDVTSYPAQVQFGA